MKVGFLVKNEMRLSVNYNRVQHQRILFILLYYWNE